MNFWKLPVYAIHDASKLLYIEGKTYLKWINSKFEEIYHNF